ncbi:carbohydrate-binding domain-containing protein [Actinomyces sp.]|uniref:carbohydrate-binding domain-containing protein n=1 Tax=Actinomyces sp. TaxID=29317 RepID=UPI0026DC7EF2|nr:carbohydrate-binding domain-containing protein [Actinomyces sp.]MDO4900190.1 carbohydrate-binding domain-containing protein [Actinomyces sp.]
MNNPLKHLHHTEFRTGFRTGFRSGRISPDAKRARRIRAGLLLPLAAITLVAGCSTGSTSGVASSGADAADSSGAAWTTITAKVAAASTGASVSDILAANADTSAATAAVTADDDAGTYDSASATTITLSGDSAKVGGAGAAGVHVDGGTITITAAGTYVLTGELTDGEVIVNADDAEVRLVLGGASITNADGPAIDIQDAGSAVVVLAAGSENTLVDGETYADAPTAALFSSDTVVLTGTGSLNVTGRHNDAISSKNGLVIQGAPTLTVDAVDDGIRGKDYLVISGGTITITADGDGLKSTEDDDETMGFIALGGADITITSGDDGVSATTDVTVEGTTLSVAAGGGHANATPEADFGGTPGQQDQQAATDTATDDEDESAVDDADKPKGVNAGVSYTQASGTVTLDAADEGLQGAFINIAGGALTITSGDDGINATNGDYVIEGHENVDSESDDGSVLTISGGQVQVSFTYSDGIDSNGSAYVTGGQVVISGQAGSMDGAVDVNGESQLIGVTGSPSVSAGDTITVTGADGTSWGMTSVFTSQYLTVLGLTEGEEYTVATTSGGSATGTAAALSSGMGGMGGPGGQGGAGGPGGQDAPAAPSGDTGMGAPGQTPADGATAEQG